jgi:methanogenic corrinoid protein MtbC1
MASEEKAQELLKRLYEAVVNMDEEAAVEISQSIIDEGIDAYRAITEGLTAGMGKVSDLYAGQQYFVPELLLCADALYAGLEILKPHIRLSEEEMKAKKQIVLGVVEGDVHDIGKNLVRVMFDAAGWIVHDLGKDVKLHRFVEEQKRTNSDVIGMSALMTTSMMAIPKVIEMAKAESPDVAIMVGGAPLTPEIAKDFGADGYADTADKAVKEALRLVEAFEKRKA